MTPLVVGMLTGVFGLRMQEQCIMISTSPHGNSGMDDSNTNSDKLTAFLQQHRKVLVLTGAGISTGSGIPDYRDHNGQWKRRPPVQHQDFVSSPLVRQRYWARSLAGWPVMQHAHPNDAHRDIATLERMGFVRQVVTQNVDRLHQKAGSIDTIDLHGRADEVVCLQCGWRESRAATHERCARLNPEYATLTAATAPDGDADLETDFSAFRVPGCPQCDGMLKPDVVFFGDNVPRARVDAVFAALAESSALLVIGSSLMVYSGFRFAREASASNKAVAILTRGRTRADELATLKLDADISTVLTGAMSALASSR